MASSRFESDNEIPHQNNAAPTNAPSTQDSQNESAESQQRAAEVHTGHMRPGNNHPTEKTESPAQDSPTATPPGGRHALATTTPRAKHTHKETNEAAPDTATSDNRRTRTNRRGRGTKPHKPNFVTRIVNNWFNRLVGAVSTGNLAGQEEEYESHRTTRDYVWNTIGIGVWGMVFPILTVVVTQLCGVEQAGMFSLAFVTGSLLMIVANYGVRTYQISDLDEAHSFSDYQINRVLTCAFMVLAGVIYCMIRGYGNEMFLISLGVYLYRMVDGLADVYEGRLQQVDKLYLAGVSQAFRSVVVLVVFCVCLLLTRNLPIACIAMAIAAAASFVVVTFPLALFETPKSRRWNIASIGRLFKQCFPLFVALFLYSLIDNMPKFVMEGVLSYDNQLYFNALYFPAQGILLTVGFIYKPLLVRMANVWADPNKRGKFDLIIVAILVVVVGVTLVTAVMMAWIGIPVMSFLYGVDFEQFRGLCFIMLAAGGVTAAIDFLYQIITVLRRQKSVTKLYLITFGFSLFIPILLVNFTGLPGAVIGYLIVMCILLVLLVWEYLRIRFEFSKRNTHKQENAEHVRPSEARAERQRRQNVHEKRSSHTKS